LVREFLLLRCSGAIHHHHRRTLMVLGIILSSFLEKNLSARRADFSRFCGLF
jgi:hypothetical protein